MRISAICLIGSWVGAATSTCAPPGIWPTSVWFFFVVEPDAPSAEKPPTVIAPCAIAQVRSSAPLSGAASSVPPPRLFALPIDDTVMSSAIPGFANAGSSVVISTAATFFAFRSAGSIVTPSFFSIFVSALFTAGERVSSPVPSRPTTRPKPVRWLSRTPPIVVRSLIRSAAAVAVSSARAMKMRMATPRTARAC